MDPREIETLVARLIANPQDDDALTRAHQGGQLDPQGYALLLERVAQGTADPAFAGHWFNEAASVWEALGDSQQMARLMRAAAARDPSNVAVTERLVELLRQRGDSVEMARTYERALEAWSVAVREAPELRADMVRVHEFLARLYADGPAANPDAAARHWAALVELNPTSVTAVYSARELLKSMARYADAVGYFDKEQALIDDPERKLALYRDEAEVRRLAGDGPGRTEALRRARSLRPDDPALPYELGMSVVERVDGGEDVPITERREAAQALNALAEMYDGEYALAYAASSLKASPGDDRAMQLADYHAERIGRSAELVTSYQAYLHENPNGYMAERARGQLQVLGQSPGPSGPPALPAQPQAAAAAAPVPAQAQPAPAPAQSAPGAAAAARPAPAEAQPASSVPELLAQANEDAQRGRKPQAFATYSEVLRLEPANPEALAWVEDFLRQRRKFAELRDVLLAAARVGTVPAETRKAQLRDVAGLCETKLRDFDTAIAAWKQICQIDRADDAAREQLCALLEKQRRWDELAPLLEQQAMNESDVESKIALEKKIAALHEQKRQDPIAAAEAWVRIAELARGDETAVQTAVALFERGEQFESAAGVLMDNIADVADPLQKGAMLLRLGDLRAKLGDAGAAGDAYVEAAQLDQKDRTWELAAQAYATAQRWGEAANAIEQRAQLHDGVRKADLLAEAARAYLPAGSPDSALMLLEQASELDPDNDQHAALIEGQYQADGRVGEHITFLLRRAAAIRDRAKRVELRHRAAGLQWSTSDEEGACDSWRLVLEDGEDRQAIEALLQAAERRGDQEEIVSLVERMLGAAQGPEKLDLALRAAQVVATGLGDVEGAILRFERILKEIDPRNRTALRAIADLEEGRGNHAQAAEALERELALTEGEERVVIAQRLAELYEGPLGNLPAAVRALDVVHGADPEDFDAVARLQALCERLEDWPRVVALLAQLIEVEGDEEEASEMTRQLATLLYEKLGKGDEALAALERPADQGDVACQQTYTEFGLALGWKGIVAQKLVQWHQAVAGSSRVEALRRAFHLFVEVGRDADARVVALDLARSKDADTEIAAELAGIASRLRDLDSLLVAFEILASPLSGGDRARELGRQAGLMLQAGASPADAIAHAEQGLGGVEPAVAEQLLSEIAALAPDTGSLLDIYERQVLRCRQPAERVAALARAAQVAAEAGALDRARDFFNAALSGGIQEEAITALQTAARCGDPSSPAGRALLLTLAESLAAGGQGSRDGGRTRSALLRRAAEIAHRELGDEARAFGWITDAVITHVDDASLDALEQLGRDVGDLRRVEESLGRALDEVFDGPLVRKLLRRRAALRREQLDDLPGAAADLKRLHDLSPAEHELTEELLVLLTELEDHRGVIELYEDQILRGRDPGKRAEVARKVARLWEEQIGDAREAGDAWRRVLRMRAGDEEATAGLERAKTGQLKRDPQAVARAASGQSPRTARSTGAASVRPDRARASSGPVPSARPGPAAVAQAAPQPPSSGSSARPPASGQSSQVPAGSHPPASQPPAGSYPAPSQPPAGSYPAPSQPPAGSYPAPSQPPVGSYPAPSQPPIGSASSAPEVGRLPGVPVGPHPMSSDPGAEPPPLPMGAGAAQPPQWGGGQPEQQGWGQPPHQAQWPASAGPALGSTPPGAPQQPAWTAEQPQAATEWSGGQAPGAQPGWQGAAPGWPAQAQPAVPPLPDQGSADARLQAERRAAQMGWPAIQPQPQPEPPAAADWAGEQPPAGAVPPPRDSVVALTDLDGVELVEDEELDPSRGPQQR